MSLFGSDSSSSSTSQTAIEQQKSLADYSAVDSGSKSDMMLDLTNLTVGSGKKSYTDFDLNVSMLDGGAIQNSYAFSSGVVGGAYDVITDLYNKAMTAINDATQRETSLVTSALNKASTMTSGEITTQQGLLIGGVVLVVAIIFFPKMRGK